MCESFCLVLAVLLCIPIRFVFCDSPSTSTKPGSIHWTHHLQSPKGALLKCPILRCWWGFSNRHKRWGGRRIYDKHSPLSSLPDPFKPSYRRLLLIWIERPLAEESFAAFRNFYSMTIHCRKAISKATAISAILIPPVNPDSVHVNMLANTENDQSRIPQSSPASSNSSTPSGAGSTIPFSSRSSDIEKSRQYHIGIDELWATLPCHNFRNISTWYLTKPVVDERWYCFPNANKGTYSPNLLRDYFSTAQDDKEHC